MITRYTTRVVLSVDPADDPMPWQVSWTITQNGRTRDFHQAGQSEAGARRLVDNLLADRLPGTEIADIYHEDLT